MARNRMIRPEFWTSEQVVGCSVAARLLFIGLWNFCDDDGRHPASTTRLRMEVFPGDDVTQGELARYVAELIDCGLLLEYSVNGSNYWQVTGWMRNQKVRYPTHLYPSPESPAATIIAGTLREYCRSVAVKDKSNQEERSQRRSDPNRVEPSRADHLDSDFWERVRLRANRTKLTPKDPRDRELILKLCALAENGTFPEDWLADALAGLAVKSATVKKPFAYLHKSLANAAAEKYRKELKPMLAALTVPAELLAAKKPP